MRKKNGWVFCVLKNVSVIIPVAKSETSHQQLLDDLKQYETEIIISSETSRATSLNQGAHKATRDYLWFLHADTRITPENAKALEEALKSEQQSIYYFDLAFDQKGLIALNALGANIRSKILGLPYGDQGFCLSKEHFDHIGGYPEDTPYGEDLLFIRKAKAKGIKLSATPSKLTTSARKYKEYGWLKLSLTRQWQLFKLMRIKI